MTWKASALYLSLRSPLHCGNLPLGFVARTFPYVPCHLPFFALVPPAVRLLGLPDRHASYVDVESLFLTSLRSTPLFVQEGETALFPWEEESLKKLEYAYIDSRYGVSLDYGQRSAKESCLYETEVILDSPRRSALRGGPPPLARTQLSGCLFYRQASCGDLSMDDKGAVFCKGRKASLLDLLSHMKLGGDRTRSFGMPAVPKLSPCPDKGVWNLYQPVLDGEWPVLNVPGTLGGPLPLALGEEQANVLGNKVVLTGRRHTENGAGLNMDKAAIAYGLGWKSSDNLKIALKMPRNAVLA